jgi:hypothetical protein
MCYGGADTLCFFDKLWSKQLSAQEQRGSLDRHWFACLAQTTGLFAGEQTAGALVSTAINVIERAAGAIRFESLVVAACNQKRSDLHSVAFSTRINCDQQQP